MPSSSFCTAMTTDFQLEEGEQGEIYSPGYGVVHEQFVTLSPAILSYLCCAWFIDVEPKEAGAEGSLGGKPLM